MIWTDKYKSAEKIELKVNLAELGKISLIEIYGQYSSIHKLWKHFIEKYHYIRKGKLYGKQIRYLIKSERYGYIGALAFSSGSWSLSDRDTWIGWNEETRIKNLKLIICNSRFLILPTVKVTNLASHILSKAIKKVKEDWRRKYKETPVMIETFVEQSRYTGACYQATNFAKIGETKGRGRQDTKHEKKLPVKDIYVITLNKKFREQLCRGQKHRPAQEYQAKDWVEEEFNKVKLGDERLKKRLYEIGRDFYRNPTANIPQACNSRARTKAAYRFLDNLETNMKKILQSHYEMTKSRFGEKKIILAVQDTTDLDYSTHPGTENLGPIAGYIENPTGLKLHNTMAFSEEGTPLGLLNVQCWSREKKEFGQGKNRKKRNLEEKESIKWIKSYKALEEVQKESPQNMIVSVCDREGDIYELFEIAEQKLDSPKLLVRAAQNRCVISEQGYLWEYMQTIEVSMIQEITVPRKPNQPARNAQLNIRFAPVEIKAPLTKRDKKNILLWSVYVAEKDPPPNVKPLEWMLLTTVPVNDIETALKIVKWYMQRWGIEIYHKTLKSGCKIENRQFGNAKRIKTCLAIDMVIAWRIYYLTKLGRETPNVPCTIFFEESEWKALTAYVTKNSNPPLTPPTLGEAIRMVASIGGFLGRKGDGNPGVTTLWRGMICLSSITEMWLVCHGPP